VDPALAEMDFGDWDGRAWAAISRAEIEAWCANFLAYAPGGGEAVAALLARVRAFDPGSARIVVTHGGWLSAALWLTAYGERMPSAEEWPPPPKPGSLTRLAWRSAAPSGQRRTVPSVR
jgi:alpha-ribazole phosphatase